MTDMSYVAKRIRATRRLRTQRGESQYFNDFFFFACQYWKHTQINLSHTDQKWFPCHFDVLRVLKKMQIDAIRQSKSKPLKHINSDSNKTSDIELTAMARAMISLTILCLSVVAISRSAEILPLIPIDQHEVTSTHEQVRDSLRNGQRHGFPIPMAMKKLVRNIWHSYNSVSYIQVKYSRLDYPWALNDCLEIHISLKSKRRYTLVHK